MNINEMAKLPCDEFILEFEKESNQNKFLETKRELNILQFAILSNNLDVVKYLLKNYPYDLKEQMSTAIWKDETIPDGYKISDLVMLSFDIFEESRVTIDSYSVMINFLIENNVLFEKLNLNIATNYLQDADALRGFFASPYFQYLIESNLIDNDISNLYLHFAIKNNEFDTKVNNNIGLNFTYDYYRRNTCEKIIKGNEFKINIKDPKDFILIIENLGNLSDLTKEELHLFKEELISSVMKNNNLNNEKDLFFLVLENKLSSYERDMSNRYRLQNLFLSKIYLNKTNLSDKLFALLKVIGFSEDKLPINENVKELTLRIKDLYLTHSLIDKFSQEEKEKLANEIAKNSFFEKNESVKDEDMKNLNFEDYVTKRWGRMAGPGEIYKKLINDDFSVLRNFKEIKSSEMTTLRHSMLANYLAIIEEERMIGVLIDESKKRYNLTRNQILEKTPENNNNIRVKYIDFYNDEIKAHLNLKMTEDVLRSDIHIINPRVYRANISKNSNEDYAFLRMLFNLKLEFNEINSELRIIKGMEDVNIENLISDFLMKNKETDFSFLAEEASTIDKLNFLENHGIYLNIKSNNLKVMHNLFLNRNYDNNYENKLMETDINLSGDDLYSFLKDVYIFSNSYNDFLSERVKAVLLEDKIQNTWFDLLNKEFDNGNKKIIDNFCLKDFCEISRHFNDVSLIQGIKNESIKVDSKSILKGVVKKIDDFESKVVELEKRIIFFEIEKEDKNTHNNGLTRKRM